MSKQTNTHTPSVMRWQCLCVMPVAVLSFLCVSHTYNSFMRCSPTENALFANRKFMAMQPATQNTVTPIPAPPPDTFPDFFLKCAFLPRFACKPFVVVLRFSGHFLRCIILMPWHYMSLSDNVFTY